MSGNTSGNTIVPKVDRRIRRTRDTLGDALLELMQEKTFDEITVQDVLDQAGVGRATFYVHYRDKQDLFLSDVEDFFEGMAGSLTRSGASVERLAPVRELCAHMVEAKDLLAAVIASGKWQDVVELGQGFFARSIQERLRLSGRELESAHLQVQAHALSGALLGLINWWIDHGMAARPQEMDALFHRMAWGGVGGSGGG